MERHGGTDRRPEGRASAGANVERLDATPVMRGGLQLRHNPDRAPSSDAHSGSVLGLDRLADELRTSGGAFGGGRGSSDAAERGLQRDADGFLIPPPRARGLPAGTGGGGTERVYRERGSDTPSHAGGVNQNAVAAISERVRAADAGGIAAKSAGAGREGGWRGSTERADASSAGRRSDERQRLEQRRDGGNQRSDAYLRDSDRAYHGRGDAPHRRDSDPGGGDGGGGSGGSGRVGGGGYRGESGDGSRVAGQKRDRPPSYDGGGGGGSTASTEALTRRGGGGGGGSSRFGAERTPAASASPFGTPASVALLDDGEGVYSQQRIRSSRDAAGGGAGGAPPDARGRRSVSVSVSSRIQPGWDDGGSGGGGGDGRSVGAWDAVEAGGGAGRDRHWAGGTPASVAAGGGGGTLREQQQAQLLAREEGDADFDRNFYDADEATQTADASDPSAGGLIVENERTAAMESRVEAARSRGENKLRGMSARKSAMHADQQVGGSGEEQAARLCPY